jgi:hypothetical protein
MGLSKDQGLLQASAPVLLASQLRPRDCGEDSDGSDEFLGADPDEVAFGTGVVPAASEAQDDGAVDWFDVDRLW